MPYQKGEGCSWHSHCSLLFHTENMYKRNTAWTMAPVAYPQRTVTRKFFFKSDMAVTYWPCDVDCLQAFRHGVTSTFDVRILGPQPGPTPKVWSYCARHDYVTADANEMLLRVFLAGHASGAIYPQGTRFCYSQRYFEEKQVCFSAMASCETCQHSFLCQRDLEEHQATEHTVER